jgi:RNA polymerase sigma factor (sigma-70 family)
MKAKSLTPKAKKAKKVKVTTEQAKVYQAMFEEQLPIIKAAKKGNPQALIKVEEMSRFLRRSKTQKFLPNRPDLHEDAMQAAWTGVLNALRKWDASWGRLFLAYAHWDIAEAIRKFKYEMESTVTRPTHVHRKLAKLAQFDTYNVDELSELSGITARNVRNAMAIRQGDISLHQAQFESEEDIGSSYAIENHTIENEPSHSMNRGDMVGILQQAMRTLDERELHILTLHYTTDATFGEIAETMNVTRQRVEQINGLAIEKLRRFFANKDPELGIKFEKKPMPKTRRAAPIDTSDVNARVDLFFKTIALEWA